MATSLYDLSVASYLQGLGGVRGVLEKGASHFAENGIDPDEIVATRLHPDMLPFRFQLISVVHQSLGAVQGLQSGGFQPPSTRSDLDYARLQDLVTNAQKELESLGPDEIDAFAGKTITFEMGDIKLPFTAENFVLSFSLPNFYFHAATAYDILRMKGVPLGKQDFLGKMKIGA